VTNHTRTLANYAKEYLESDIFEIVPKQEYTAEDINYNTDCRANREQNDDSARPEIKFTIEDISQYDTIILGYPIWWGQAPKILYTFIESYDFNDKTILPFCTSGSSSIGSSATNLAKSAPEAKWLEGRRFSSSTSKEEIASWLDNYIEKEVTMNLYIDEKELDVTWENNDSVIALKKLVPLTINMHEYGGFEQTGSIGASIIRNDKQMDVVPGDIVLYNGNAISVFYNKSAWSYTRLGHINMNESELNDLLNKSSVTFALKS
jgi:flavodoxin